MPQCLDKGHSTGKEIMQMSSDKDRDLYILLKSLNYCGARVVCLDNHGLQGDVGVYVYIIYYNII